MESLKVALLQLLPGSSLQENLNIGVEACRKAKTMGADIALFPEMWSTGYSVPKTAEERTRASVSAESPFVQRFSELARELNMAVGITALEAYEPLPRNTLFLFDRFGRMVLRYAKVHTCDFSERERALTPGDDFYAADLDTENGIVKVGAMICFDREQPESARILMLKGAEIILVPNACTMEINRLSQLRTRAYENMLGIATVNYPFGHPDCNGHSTAFDGIAYMRGEEGSHDSLIVEAGQREGIFLADFPLEELRDYR
ncbi:MAG: carbon-nitrogen hydrolase family protein, partial [Clostridia bacterium]|nr:carbon-nitrogen hydrolase family protein [Clostridia bacterium]